MSIFLILYLLTNPSYGCSQDPNKSDAPYKPRWVQPSENTQDKKDPPIEPKPFLPAPIDTKQPILKRMDALTLSSNPNTERQETPTPKPKKDPSKEGKRK